MAINLINLVERWMEENDIQHMHGGLPDILVVSARCWNCAAAWGRFVELYEENAHLVVDPPFQSGKVKIPAADPHFFIKLVVALKRCEHMPKVRVEGLSI